MRSPGAAVIFGMLGFALAGCSSPTLEEVARADFDGAGVGRDERSFECAGEGRIEVASTSPDGWLSVSVADPTGREAFGQVFDGGPDAGRSDGSFGFAGEGGPGWTLAVERHGYTDERFEGSYAIRVSC